eukprot:scaffold22288_cov153-Skeletonema_dohrnii-CCMP3373.AAC.5
MTRTSHNCEEPSSMRKKVVHVVRRSSSMPVIMTTFEQQYRQYLSIFDGEKIDGQAANRAREMFNAVYHGNVQSTEYGGYPINRSQIEHLHKLHLSLGSKITLIHFREEGLQAVDVKFQVVNKQENTIVHNILTLEDNKIIKVQTREDYDEEMLDFLLQLA